MSNASLVLHTQLLRTHLHIWSPVWPTARTPPWFWHSSLPVPHHYATSLIAAQSKACGKCSQSILPSCFQALCHFSRLAWLSAAATLALSATSSKADAWCVPVCSHLCLCSACTLPTHLHLLPCVFVAMFKIHCHVLVDNLPAPSSGGKAWLLLVG